MKGPDGRMLQLMRKVWHIAILLNVASVRGTSATGATLKVAQKMGLGVRKTPWRSSGALRFVIWAGLAFYFPQMFEGQSQERDATLGRALGEYVAGKHFPGEDDTRYQRAFVDLNEDGKEEAVVFLVGRWWCGSGGCATVILEQEGGGWRRASIAATTDTPIRVLEKRSMGWHSIGVWTREPGGAPCEVELQFDGKHYPMRAAGSGASKMKGRVIIANGDTFFKLRGDCSGEERRDDYSESAGDRCHCGYGAI